MTRFRNAMLDIETHSLLMGAGIMQIGVALFDIDADRPDIETASFHARIEPGNDLSDPETLQWWKDTDEGLFLDLMRISAGSPSIASTLNDLGAYLTAHGVEQIWASRVAFDVGQLHMACQNHGVERPWRFNRIRDGATAVQMCEDLTGSRPHCPKPEGFRAHDGVWDALNSARIVRAAYAQVRSRMQPMELQAAA